MADCEFHRSLPANSVSLFDWDKHFTIWLLIILVRFNEDSWSLPGCSVSSEFWFTQHGTHDCLNARGMFVDLNLSQNGPVTSSKWSYIPYEWPYKCVTGVIILCGVLFPFTTSRVPSCMFQMSLFLKRPSSTQTFMFYCLKTNDLLLPDHSPYTCWGLVFGSPKKHTHKIDQTLAFIWMSIHI